MEKKPKVLFVCSGNSSQISPFIAEQANSVSDNGYDVLFFRIKGKGVLGYLKNIAPLKRIIQQKDIALIHAHYGYSGLLVALAASKPFVITYHGTDINCWKSNILSSISALRASWNIYVSDDLRRKPFFKFPKRTSVIPCGVDENTFIELDRAEARKRLNLDLEGVLILFSSNFNNQIKNFALAEKALLETKQNIQIIELSNKGREEVSLLFNAVNLLLLTSFSEGSPQVIKEAMSCNCPIVATNVGDIKWVFGTTKGCYLTSFDPKDVSNKIMQAILFSNNPGKTNGRNRILDLGLDSETIGKRIGTIYNLVISKHKNIR